LDTPQKIPRPLPEWAKGTRSEAWKNISTQSTEKPVAHQNAAGYVPRSVDGKRAGPKRAQAAPAFFIG
jgi:hypothetical protein